MFEWTDELKASVIEKYEAAEPNAENSADIVSDIAEEIGATPNGVRAILVRAEKYIKKTPTKGTSTASSGATGAKKASKADSQAALTAAIAAKGLEADEEIIGKLTGKAAAYFAEIIAG